MDKYIEELRYAYLHPEPTKNSDEWIDTICHGNQCDADIMGLVGERDALSAQLKIALDENMHVMDRRDKALLENDAIHKQLEEKEYQRKNSLKLVIKVAKERNALREQLDDREVQFVAMWAEEKSIENERDALRKQLEDLKQRDAAIVEVITATYDQVHEERDNLREQLEESCDTLRKVRSIINEYFCKAEIERIGGKDE
jgi:chromosome segregation ATPase